MRTIEKCWAQEAKDRPAVDAVFSSFEMAVEPEIAAMASDIGSDIRGAAEDATGAIGSGGLAGSLLGASLGGALGVTPASAGSAADGLTGLGLFAGAGGGDRAAGLAAFLRAGDTDLSRHLDKLVDLGFCDVETLSDRELLDDAMLATEVGMNKLEIRELRHKIEAQGTGPTMLKKRLSAAAARAVGKGGGDDEAAKDKSVAFRGGGCPLRDSNQFVSGDDGRASLDFEEAEFPQLARLPSKPTGPAAAAAVSLDGLCADIGAVSVSI